MKRTSARASRSGNDPDAALDRPRVGPAEQIRRLLSKTSEGAGLEFIDRVEKALETALRSPHRFPKAPDVDEPEVRRALIVKYGVWVIYEVHPDALVVLSVWHGAQDPEGWREQ